MPANQNFNNVYGWDAQQLGAAGTGLSGYAQPANAPVAANVSAAEQPLSGASFSPSPTAVPEVLVNPGYAASPALMTPGPITPPSIPASTVAATNTSGLPATVSISGGTVTVVAVAAVGGSFVTVATSTPCTVVVPPGGQIKMTYSVVPTSWGWTLGV